jgi:hypothetical protein
LLGSSVRLGQAEFRDGTMFIDPILGTDEMVCDGLFLYKEVLHTTFIYASLPTSLNNFDVVNPNEALETPKSDLSLEPL